MAAGALGDDAGEGFHNLRAYGAADDERVLTSHAPDEVSAMAPA